MLETSDSDEAMQIIEREALGLAGRARSQPNIAPTSLLVIDDHAVEDVGEFAALCRRAQQRVAQLADADGEIVLLGFHPDRLDVGPGCSTVASDAAHFTVRSPHPTLQVLRAADVATAREQWRQSHDDGTPGKTPGALGLLNGNKRRLRAIGTLALQRMLRACTDGDAEESQSEMEISRRVCGRCRELTAE